MVAVKELLGDELYGKVQEKLGNDKGLLIDDGMLIPKHRFDCVNLSLKDHKKLVADYKEENDRIKARISQIEKIETELAELKSERCILEIILQAKPKNYKAVLSLINTGGLTGKQLIQSVKRQLTVIKKEEPYLFFDTEKLYRLVPVEQSG